ncbi:MAG TPA: tRNA (adenosine(37)-N6)-threonylcarbamoyltransferase complex dimerization subunit type 1 TsaB [Nitrospiraceae bacterium]|nr:tRNA (adenosine(37)-N6)-threonylcarbamoyltransferase complex dimerization subunit type 1 TsaB [Nitrospiraceae bacterium]
MKILAVDTATAYQSVAILDETTVLAQVNRDAQGSHARYLVLSVEEALRAAGLALGDIDGFALSIGPGSFTGLRVGLATMLGFRSVLGKPLVTVPTLEAMAWNVRSVTGRICPILKSRKEEVYWAAYEWSSDHGPHRLIPEQVTSPDHIAASIHEPVVVLGDGWKAYEKAIRTLLGSRAGLVSEAPQEAMHPSAVSVAFAARKRFAEKQFAGAGVAPLYVQRAEADLTYERNGGISPVERRMQRAARRTRPKYAGIASASRRSRSKKT